MKIVVPGGTGHLGTLLCRALRKRRHEVVVLSRSAGPHSIAWDGKTLGPWADVIDGADAVINLAGRSVNCRYTEQNLAEMLASRVDSTRVVGEAIARARRPPKVWLQMSTATVYAHTLGSANDETGLIGGNETGVPAYWKRSVDIALAWERALFDADTPKTRKVALRTTMVMANGRGGVFEVLARLARLGLGGRAGTGQQFVSWIHARDFVRAIEWLLERDDFSGVVNLAAPRPLPQSELMKTLRVQTRAPLGLPASRWMLELGAFFLRTDTELLLKSRRVVSSRLAEAGFRFDFPDWSLAAADLVHTPHAG